MHHHIHHGSWFAHQVGSSLIHGVVYGVIYKLFRDLSLPMILLFACVVLAAEWSRCVSLVECLLSGLSSSGIWPGADRCGFRRSGILTAGLLRNLPEGQREQIDQSRNSDQM